MVKRELEKSTKYSLRCLNRWVAMIANTVCACIYVDVIFTFRVIYLNCVCVCKYRNFAV